MLLFSNGRARCALALVLAATPWLFAVNAAQAGNPADWRNVGPFGGTLLSVYKTEEASPRLVARGYRNLYKSLDGGLTWTKLSASSPVGEVLGNNTIALPASEPNTIYALSGVGKLFRSEDFGGNWDEVFDDEIDPGNSPSFAQLTAIAVHPDDASNLYLYGYWREIGSVYLKFHAYRRTSTDRGATWDYEELLACQYHAPTVRSVAFTSAAPRARLELIPSTACDGPPPLGGGLRPGLTAIGGNFPSNYFPLYNYRSRHEYVPSALQTTGNTAFVLGHGDLTRIDLSLGNSTLLRAQATAFTARSQSELYVATSGGVSRSDDGGATWIPLSNNAAGLGSVSDARAMLTLPDQQVLITGASGPALSDDRGESWRSAASGVVEMKSRALSVEPGSGMIWAATMQGPTNSFQPAPGSFRSLDGGTSWQQSNLHTYAWFLRHIRVDPTTALRPGGSRVYATGIGCRFAVERCPSTAVHTPNSGIYVSDDGGMAFRAEGSGVPISPQPQGPFVGIVRDVSMDPNSFAGGKLQRVFVSGSRDAFKPGRSEDAGANWNTSNGVPSDDPNLTLDVQQTVFDPNRVGRAYAAVVSLHTQPPTTSSSESGVFRSDDAGANWQVASQGLPAFGAVPGATQSIYSVAVDHSTANRLWATTRSEEGESNIYRSDDGADSWYSCGRVAGANFLGRIAQDPDRPSRIVVGDRGIEGDAGSRNGGAWISDNRCLTWQRLGRVLDAGVFDLAIANGKAYAASEEGVQVIDIPAEQDGVLFLSSFE